MIPFDRGFALHFVRVEQIRMNYFDRRSWWSPPIAYVSSSLSIPVSPEDFSSCCMRAARVSVRVRVGNSHFAEQATHILHIFHFTIILFQLRMVIAVTMPAGKKHPQRHSSHWNWFIWHLIPWSLRSSHRLDCSMSLAWRYNVSFDDFRHWRSESGISYRVALWLIQSRLIGLSESQCKWEWYLNSHFSRVIKVNSISISISFDAVHFLIA
jgi:hypothetical protein